MQYHALSWKYTLLRAIIRLLLGFYIWDTWYRFDFKCTTITALPVCYIKMSGKARFPYGAGCINKIKNHELGTKRTRFLSRLVASVCILVIDWCHKQGGNQAALCLRPQLSSWPQVNWHAAGVKWRGRSNGLERSILSSHSSMSAFMCVCMGWMWVWCRTFVIRRW